MMRVRSILLVGFIVVSKLLVGQNFEGEIIYSNTIKSKLPNFTDEQLKIIVGDRQEYFIREGNYKSITNGQAIVMQLYDDKTNRIYNKKLMSDTLYWFSVSHRATHLADTLFSI